MSKDLMQSIIQHFGALSNVQAIALADSQTTGFVDDHSDLDFYIYTTEPIPVNHRINMIKEIGASKVEFDLQFWDLNDAWIDSDSGIEVDMIYWDIAWIETQIERVLIRHQASVGYSTCFWHTVLISKLLFERENWFTNLQSKCLHPYPEGLRDAILAKNHPILRNVSQSYYEQIKNAIERNDLISINHRLSALFASYFDVLFALNFMPNPGEKRVLDYALKACSKVPENLRIQVEEVLGSATWPKKVFSVK